MGDNGGTIPRSLQNPKIGRVNDTEVIGDLVAELEPIFRHCIAQECTDSIGKLTQ